MYLPKIFKSEDFDVAKEIIKTNSFANLIIYKERILSSYAMMLLNGEDKDNFYIETHLSRANPIARNLKDIKSEVVCDFLGAHAYISSSWYNHISVSTWNYEAVKIYGQVEMMTDEELYNHLYKLTNKFELPQACPMTVEKIGKQLVEKEMKGAIGFKILPTEIMIKQKLSQNKDEINRQKIIQALEKSNAAINHKVAEKMKNL